MLDIPGILDRRLTRRTLLAGGGVAALGTFLNQTAGAGGAPSLGATPLRSCIIVMLYGGPSHVDTWDMKPSAPVEIRGAYRSIATSVPGRFVCEHLPHCAAVVDRLAIVHSMHHSMANHNSAMYQALVGRRPKIDLDVLGAERATDFPNVGATVDYAGKRSLLPPPSLPLAHVALPHVMHNVVDLPGQNAGFLGGEHDPLQINADPNRSDFSVPNLSQDSEDDGGRLSKRLALLQHLETHTAWADSSAVNAYRARAYELLHSPPLQRALRLDQEPSASRDAYGRHTLGQSLLLARKLVEAGVRVINVNDQIYNGQDANWDSHEKIFPRHRQLLAPLDQGLAALVLDLEQRGLLESTLVVVMGEFGRTPRVNANAGRDHWPDCYSVVLAGGGVVPGSTFGASDRWGAYPVSQPVTPGDLAATIFWRFGVDPTHTMHDPLGRPFPLADGRAIRGIFAA